VGSGGAEEQRSRGVEERRKKRELIIFGYKAQEIPPKISFTQGRLYTKQQTTNNQQPTTNNKFF